MATHTISTLRAILASLCVVVLLALGVPCLHAMPAAHAAQAVPMMVCCTPQTSIHTTPLCCTTHPQPAQAHAAVTLATPQPQPVFLIPGLTFSGETRHPATTFATTRGSPPTIPLRI